jgi:hypothetical protein
MIPYLTETAYRSIYFGSQFQRVPSMVAWLYALGQDITVMGMGAHDGIRSRKHKEGPGDKIQSSKAHPQWPTSFS